MYSSDVFTILYSPPAKWTIIESVDTICRDGADTPISRQTICSASAFIRYNTHKLSRIYSYSDFWKIVKTRIVHLPLLLLPPPLPPPPPPPPPPPSPPPPPPPPLPSSSSINVYVDGEKLHVL